MSLPHASSSPLHASAQPASAVVTYTPPFNYDVHAWFLNVEAYLRALEEGQPRGPHNTLPPPSPATHARDCITSSAIQATTISSSSTSTSSTFSYSTPHYPTSTPHPHHPLTPHNQQHPTLSPFPQPTPPSPHQHYTDPTHSIYTSITQQQSRHHINPTTYTPTSVDHSISTNTPFSIFPTSNTPPTTVGSRPLLRTG
ncbi:hypothetical protein Pcinc_004341 [Petrolisthes cinctipes]|uniref:Uncharacterized protein n=1 Tax=Petrolisthes cinctipes TaxID=88211 RepID=A0AAE1L090_PETCI|nr:hypothetical protein Pcinc_004341 [Petrolisthes cinctipes]